MGIIITTIFILIFGTSGVIDKIMSEYGPPYFIFAGLVVITFFAMVILSGFMFSAHGKSSALAILSYCTLGILPLIYSRIIIKKCKVLEADLRQYESDKIAITNQIEKTETEIIKTQKSLEFAKEELNKFIKVHIN